MKNEHYLYFAEGNGADAAGDAVMFPVSRFIGVEPITATTTGIYFRSALGDVDGGGGGGDYITVTHADTHETASSYHRAKLIAEAMCEVANATPHKAGVVTTVIDMDTNAHFTPIDKIKGDSGFAIAITLDT
jgi:hypothetical protein|tara:strand:+ start:918 stop:1313 length:396 start_codon:yes stop_codon:yes gene_type:complete